MLKKLEEEKGYSSHDRKSSMKVNEKRGKDQMKKQEKINEL